MIRAAVVALMLLPWFAAWYFRADSAPVYSPPFINALLWASPRPEARAQTERVKNSLSHGQNPNFFYLHHTPLHIAVSKNNAELIRELVAHGALINRQDCRDGFTPLMDAARFGHRDALIALLQAGADESITSRNGKTAADLAKNDEIRKILDDAPDRQN